MAVQVAVVCPPASDTESTSPASTVMPLADRWFSLRWVVLRKSPQSSARRGIIAASCWLLHVQFPHRK